MSNKPPTWKSAPTIPSGVKLSTATRVPSFVPHPHQNTTDAALDAGLEVEITDLTGDTVSDP